MYKLRPIFAALLSLLIIYTGAGVAIAHYCCAKCDVQEAHACHDAVEHYCPDFGCSTVIYKIDLVKEASTALTISSLIAFCYQLLPDFRFASPTQECLLTAGTESPPLLPRCYLALYSVLLI